MFVSPFLRQSILCRRTVCINCYHVLCCQPAPVKITFGYGPNEDCGIMMYHRNRLIKAYEKVGSQKQVNEVLWQ